MTKPITKKKLKVLLIENNKVDRRMLHGMLSKSSYGAFAAEMTESLTQATQILRERKFDVALLDLNLPDSRGMGTLHKLNKEFPDLPIVVNTGVYQDELGLKAITRGAQDYLIKGKYESYGLSKSLYYAVARKRAEQELAQAYEKFKETQTQLIQVEKMNVIGSLASGVAHEVKNPLATIMYGVEFLHTKLNTDDPQVSFTLNSIRDATRRANDIIKDLLDFASLSKMEIKPENFNTVIDQSLNLIKHQIDKQRIQIVKNFDPVLPRIRIDVNRMEQVLLDLLLNAVHAMPDGGKLIITTLSQKFSDQNKGIASLTAGRFREGDRLVLVDIDDTGVGIPQEYIDKIFDPFFTTRRAAGGVGLGLSIARTIVKNHGGVVRIENRPEGGVRARLVFRAEMKRGEKAYAKDISG